MAKWRGASDGQHTVLLHDLQELDNDLGRRSDQDLALAGLLGVVDVLEGIVENGGADHLGGCVGMSWRRFSNLVRDEVSADVMLAFGGPRSVKSALKKGSTAQRPKERSVSRMGKVSRRRRVAAS